MFCTEVQELGKGTVRIVLAPYGSKEHQFRHLAPISVFYTEEPQIADTVARSIAATIRHYLDRINAPSGYLPPDAQELSNRFNMLQHKVASGELDGPTVITLLQEAFSIGVVSRSGQEPVLTLLSYHLRVLENALNGRGPKASDAKSIVQGVIIGARKVLQPVSA